MMAGARGRRDEPDPLGRSLSAVRLSSRLYAISRLDSPLAPLMVLVSVSHDPP